MDLRQMCVFDWHEAHLKWEKNLAGYRKLENT